MSYTFTTEQILAWADEQEPWANEVWLKTPEAIRGYKLALHHLRVHANNPIKEII